MFRAKGQLAALSKWPFCLPDQSVFPAVSAIVCAICVADLDYLYDRSVPENAISIRVDRMLFR
jgi:hypothetical protein